MVALLLLLPFCTMRCVLFSSMVSGVASSITLSSNESPSPSCSSDLVTALFAITCSSSSTSSSKELSSSSKRSIEKADESSFIISGAARLLLMINSICVCASLSDLPSLLSISISMSYSRRRLFTTTYA